MEKERYWIEKNGCNHAKTIIDMLNAKSANAIIYEPPAALFQKIAADYSNNKALIYLDSFITYHELNSKSDFLAKRLLDNNVDKGDVVGIIERSPINVAIAIIAVLKVGAAHIVIDADLPRKRIEKMIADCNIKLLLTADVKLHWVNIAYHHINEAQNEEDGNFIPRYGYDNDAVYVVYTSGTTGSPKGIRIKCKSLINYILWRNKEYEIQNDDVLLQVLSPSSFDGYLINLYSALLSGAVLLCLEKSERANFVRLAEISEKYGITSIGTNPNFIFNLITNGFTNVFHQCKSIIMGGECIDPVIISTLNSEFPAIKLFNEYGPSECCMATTSHRIRSTKDRKIIGKAIDNAYVLVVNQNEKPLPPGFIGEICIGGIGVADGYINDDALTELKFVPYASTNAAIYKTGDFGYMLENGELVFIGRRDKLVKVNGYRIDLSEIEDVLTEVRQIEKAIVIVTPNAQLHAYIKQRHGVQIYLAQIYEFLAKSIPAYMIPCKFFRFSEEYYTLSEKLDMNKIKANATEIIQQPDEEITESEGCFINQVVNICESVLCLHNIKPTDNFFAIGGNSLAALRVIVELINIGISVPDSDALFKYQTIYDFANYVAKQRKIQ